MINKFRISHRTVATIMKLRDEENCSWEVIELITGHDAGTCREHYILNKENPGKVFYFSEFLEKIKKMQMETMDVRKAHDMCVSMGYEGSYASFRNRPDIKRLPLKGSTVLKQKRITHIFTKAKLDPSKSLRDLVWEVFHDYTPSGKYRILNELSEITYE